MISEILIGSASFLLALFCLIYVNKTRGSRRPAPGPLGALKDRHTVYSGTLFALMTASAVSVIKCVLSLSGAETGVLKVFGIIYIAFQIIFFLIFVLYAVNVFIRGSGKSDRAAVLVLTAVILTGAAIRVFFSVGVELFFEAVALFGCMILLEQKDDAANSGKNKYPHFGVMIAVAVTLAAVLVINVLLIMNISNTQSDKLGNTQLDVIKSELQDTITEAEANLLHTSIGAEQLMESGASRGELLKYFYGQREKYLTNDSFKNVYIAGPDWHIVPDFDAPEDFHAAERVWYI